jgi:hypothetical protein
MRAAASFAALFIGWVAMIASFVAWMVYFTRWGHVTDWNFFRVWPGIFCLLAWVIFALPLTSVRRLWKVETNLIVAPILGCSVALLSYVLLVLTWAPEVWGFSVFALIVGGVAGLAYALLLRWKVPVWASCALPVTCAVLWFYLVLPLALNRIPDVAFRFTSGATQRKAFEKIIKRVRQGDSWSRTRERYPMLSVVGTHGSPTDGGCHFEIIVDKATDTITRIVWQSYDHQPDR